MLKRDVLNVRWNVAGTRITIFSAHVSNFLKETIIPYRSMQGASKVAQKEGINVSQKQVREIQFDF